LSNEELKKIAMDETQARELTRKLIFEKKESWRTTNSFKKMTQGRCANMEIDLINLTN
jgi:hypothetical protein